MRSVIAFANASGSNVLPCATACPFVTHLFITIFCFCCISRKLLMNCSSLQSVLSEEAVFRKNSISLSDIAPLRLPRFGNTSLSLKLVSNASKSLRSVHGITQGVFSVPTASDKPGWFNSLSMELDISLAVAYWVLVGGNLPSLNNAQSFGDRLACASILFVEPSSLSIPCNKAKSESEYCFAVGSVGAVIDTACLLFIHKSCSILYILPSSCFACSKASALGLISFN